MASEPTTIGNFIQALLREELTVTKSPVETKFNDMENHLENHRQQMTLQIQEQMKTLIFDFRQINNQRRQQKQEYNLTIEHVSHQLLEEARHHYHRVGWFHQ